MPQTRFIGAARRADPTAARTSWADERGFTLIELMVVILIIAILFAVALPTFLSQRSKGGDAVAKELMHTAANAAVMYTLSNNTSGMSPSALQGQVSNINISSNGQATLAAAAPTGTGYSLAVVSSNADTFYWTVANGIITRTCTVARGNGNTSTNTGGGCTNGAW